MVVAWKFMGSGRMPVDQDIILFNPAAIVFRFWPTRNHESHSRRNLNDFGSPCLCITAPLEEPNPLICGHLRNLREIHLVTLHLCTSARPHPPVLHPSAESAGDSPCDFAPLRLCETPSSCFAPLSGFSGGFTCCLSPLRPDDAAGPPRVPFF